MEFDDDLFEFLKNGENRYVPVGKIKTKKDLFEFVNDNFFVIKEIEDTIRDHYKKELELKKRHNFDNSPILREKILDFFEKCYKGDAFFYEVVKNKQEDIEACRLCGTEMVPDDNFCVICNKFVEPISAKSGRMTGEEIVEAVGGDFERYRTALSSQITPTQSKVSRQLNRIGIEMDPKDIPSGLTKKKEIVEWIKRKYAQIFISDRQKMVEFMKDFKLVTNLPKLKKELESIIESDSRKYTESARDIFSTKIKSSLEKANVGEQLYKKITLKLRDEGVINKGQIMNDINLAILDWAINTISKNELKYKYNLSTKMVEFETMVSKWVEMGIVFPPQRGFGGPKLTPDYSNLD